MVESMQEKIKNIVEKNKIVIFMKGVPEAPQCGFSAQSVHILQQAGAKNIVAVDVLADPAIREGIKAYTQWPTIPQIFINGEFIGGCDIVTEMAESGELKKTVEAV
ncbi:MAG: Grx4 family monothiol glutaredoxin [Deltaproteobacteria bacterium]|nr:Grx4 family monothiol glutaredoxin [Deltaproteobacteria bacterium]